MARGKSRSIRPSPGNTSAGGPAGRRPSPARPSSPRGLISRSGDAPPAIPIGAWAVSGWPGLLTIPVGARYGLGGGPVLPEVLPQRGLHLVQPVLADPVRPPRRLDPRHQLVDARLLLPRQPVGGLLQHLVVLVEADAVEALVHHPTP